MGITKVSLPEKIGRAHPTIGRHIVHQKKKEKENETKIEEIFSGNNKANLKEIDEEKTKKKSKQNIIIKINLFASNLKK